MARYATLFPSTQAAEQAARALSDWEMGEQVRAQIVSADLWNKTFETDESGALPSGALPRDVDTNLDLWIDDKTVKTFSQGLAEGGAVLVIDAPEELSKQVFKIVKDNQGKFE